MYARRALRMQNRNKTLARGRTAVSHAPPPGAARWRGGRAWKAELTASATTETSSTTRSFIRERLFFFLFFFILSFLFQQLIRILGNWPAATEILLRNEVSKGITKTTNPRFSCRSLVISWNDYWAWSLRRGVRYRCTLHARTGRQIGFGLSSR